MRAGEKVLAYNPHTRKMEWQPIMHVWIHQDNDLVDLTITTPAQAPSRSNTHGSPQTREVVHTNKKHPFLTREKGFLAVSQIKLGMHVLRADGTYGVVTGWKAVPGVKAMYNLEVAQDHTFTVGSGQWVVHNCGGTLANGIDVTIPEERFNHSFDRHAEEWFGRPVTSADRPAWENLINRTMESSQVFSWDLRGQPTIGVLARVSYFDEMRPFVIQFYLDTGEFATAFRPNAEQLDAIYRLLSIR